MGLPLIARVVRALERLLLGLASDAANDSGLARGWVGPRLETLVEPRPESRHLLLVGHHYPHSAAHREVHLCVRVEGRCVGRFTLDQRGAFTRRLPLPPGLLSPLRVEIDSQPYFVPDEFTHSGDLRRLCFNLHVLQPVP